MRQQEETLLTIRTESTWTYASWVRFRLIQSGNNYALKGHYHKRKFSETPSRPKLQKVKVDTVWAESLVKKLYNAQIPAFPQPAIGFDGGFTILTIGNYLGSSSFRWWSEPPIGWETLDEITKEFIQKFYDGICINEE
ncbi:MAG: hypothetical protein WCS73_01480 [Lentisphaeria bacterium]